MSAMVAEVNEIEEAVNIEALWAEALLLEEQWRREIAKWVRELGPWETFS